MKCTINRQETLENIGKAVKYSGITSINPGMKYFAVKMSIKNNGVTIDRFPYQVTMSDSLGNW